MSREPAIIFDSGPKWLEIGRGSSKSEIELDGASLRDRRRLTAEDLRKGVILTVAGQFVFVLHTGRYPVTSSPSFGFVGVGDAIEDVRRLIAKSADLTAPVLVRGESGTGKELVANAVHQASRRRSKPFVAVNMAVIRPERAAAELFGYERGAFTGATEAHPGLFRAAHGGTLFLDEIGLTPPEVQPMLLRVLDDQKVQPLGASQPRQVDIRLVAATDARLEEAVAAGRFEPALFHRLNSAVKISLPALRDRREDIGPLLVGFLQQELTAMGELHRLDEPPPRTRHWLPAQAVAEMCGATWPGNVRELRGIARDLALRASEGDGFDAYRFVHGYLERQLAGQRSAVRGSEIGIEQIVDALEQGDWNISRAAGRLGIDKSTLSRRLGKEGELRLLVKTSRADLERKRAAAGGDVAVLARELGVSEALLARRLRVLRDR